MYGEGEFTGFP